MQDFTIGNVVFWLTILFLKTYVLVGMFVVFDTNVVVCGVCFDLLYCCPYYDFCFLPVFYLYQLLNYYNFY